MMGCQGGAISAQDNVNVWCDGCKFELNTASKQGGALYFANLGAFRCTGCEFKKNTAEGGGGAVAAYGGLNLQCNSCKFELNSAVFYNVCAQHACASAERTADLLIRSCRLLEAQLDL